MEGLFYRFCTIICCKRLYIKLEPCFFNIFFVPLRAKLYCPIIPYNQVRV